MGKFRIKISSSWFSRDFVVLKYSTNGIFWKSIRCLYHDVFYDRCYMKIKIIHFSNAEYELSKFKTMEDVKKYQENERKRVIERNSEILLRNKMHEEKLNNIYRKFS